MIGEELRARLECPEELHQLLTVLMQFNDQSGDEIADGGQLDLASIKHDAGDQSSPAS
jgi:hypothetical protein